MLALTGGTIYVSPADDPVRDGVVLVDGDTIAAIGRSVPPDAETLDCGGATISAGFWNSHVHFFERKWADAASIPASELARQLRDTFTRYGFTSVFDLSSSLANTRVIRERIERGEVAGPRIRTTGEGLVPPGAMPPDAVLQIMGVVNTPLPEIADAAQAAATARRLLDQGVDGIKLFASTPRGTPLPAGAMDAAVDEAHRAGKPVFVHPTTGDDVLAALRAGIAAGGAVLFGTDLGAVDPDPSDEYALMAAAGMRFRDILASLTTAPAARFGGSARLTAGAPADVVVFEGEDFANVRYTLRAGAVLFRR